MNRFALCGVFALFLLASTVAPAAGPVAMKTARPPLATSVSFDAAGRLWRVYVAEGRLQVDHSEDLGANFGKAVAVTSGTEAVAAEGELRPEVFATADGMVYVAWTSPLPTPYAGHIRFARSVDGGRSFAAPITVNDNRDAITHRFQTMHVAPSGRITLTWIDKRDLEAAKRAGKAYRGAAIYYAVSDDRGQTFRPNARLAPHSCECCRIAMATDSDGQPVALWRHVFADGTRDHALVRVIPGSEASDPARATAERWKVDACPHHGPDLSVATDGIRHGAWFNQAGGEPGLFYGRWSSDGTALAPAVRFGSPNAAHPSILVLGSRVVLAWKYFTGEHTAVSTMISNNGGMTWSSPRDVATASGASDHPRLISWRGQAFLSWSTEREGYRLLALDGQGARP